MKNTYLYRAMKQGIPYQELFTDFDQAIKKLEQDFWNGTAARGIVLDSENLIGYVVVERSYYDEYKPEYQIVETEDSEQEEQDEIDYAKEFVFND